MIDAEKDVMLLGGRLRESGWRMATAESCTGGLVASTLTDVSGSSDWFDGGIVAYANAVKSSLLQVPERVLESYGAVSEETVLAMVRGARDNLGVDVAVALSGVAGPSGGTPEKPVGTVWMAWIWPGGIMAERFLFAGDRAGIKEQSVRAAIRGLLSVVRKS